MPALPPSRRRSTAGTAASPHLPKGESSPVPRRQQNRSELSLCSGDQHCAGCCFPAKEIFFSPQAGPTGTARKDPGEEWNFQSPPCSCTFTGWACSSAAPSHPASPAPLTPSKGIWRCGVASPASFHCCSHAAPGALSMVLPVVWLHAGRGTAKPNPRQRHPTACSALRDRGVHLPAPTATPHFLISPSELRINYLAARGRLRECLKHAELRL